MWTLLSLIQHTRASWSKTPRFLSLIDRKEQDDPNIANISMLRICAWAEHQIGRMHCFCQTNDPTSIRRHRQYAHNSFIFPQILFIFLQFCYIFVQILLIFSNIVPNLLMFFIIATISFMIAHKCILLTFCRILNIQYCSLYFALQFVFFQFQKYQQALSVFSCLSQDSFKFLIPRVRLQSHCNANKNFT